MHHDKNNWEKKGLCKIEYKDQTKNNLKQDAPTRHAWEMSLLISRAMNSEPKEELNTPGPEQHVQVQNMKG